MLNAITENDCYPLPHVEDFCLSLRGATIFSTIDLVRAFHQIPLDERSIPLTAVATPFGLYEFTRMPFGLKNAAQSFQRFMDEALRGLKGVYCYVDDILVASSSPAQHRTHLTALFDRLRTFGLLVNKTKTVLGKADVKFLGFSLSAAGVRTLDTQVNDIKSFPEPQTVRSLQGFLGLANFYRRCTPHFAHIAQPLYALLKSHSSRRLGARKAAEKQLTWTSDALTAFVSLKEALADQVTLSFPDAGLPSRLVTDALTLLWVPFWSNSQNKDGARLGFSAESWNLVSNVIPRMIGNYWPST
jgi:Reverse transcriptase (RNA-dependent DNA polymerase).